MKKKVSALAALKATVFVLVAVGLISYIASNINSDIINPISKTLSDFKLSDIYFSHIKESPKASDNIVLVNIGDLPREGIADLVNTLNKYEPKAIGIDAFFRDPKTPKGDSALAAAFANTKNLVLVNELIESDTGVGSVSYSNSMFTKYAKPGFADMITNGHNHFKVARECIPFETLGKDTLYSFPTMLAKIYDPEKAKILIDRNHEYEEINYQGNIITQLDGASKNAKNVFSVLDWNEVLEEKFEPETVKDKIILMGFMGSYLGDPKWEDKFFTPLNENYLGKTNPDMFGVVVHANIVAMILNQDYINNMSKTTEYIISLVLLYFTVWLFSIMFLNLDEWWDGASMVLSLGALFFHTFLTFVIFHLYNYKYDLSLAMVGIFLSANLVEYYFALILPAYRKFSSKRAVNLAVVKAQEEFVESEKTPH